MLNIYKKWRVRREVGFERTPKLQSASSFVLLSEVGLIGAMGAMSYLSAFVDRNYAIASGAFAGMMGAIGRGVRDTDNYFVSRHMAGKRDAITAFMFRRLAHTPIRYYTVNQLAKRVEDIEGVIRERALHQVKKEQQAKLKQGGTEDKKKAVSQDVTDERTFSYIRRLADNRRHMRHIMVVVVGVFAGVRTLTGGSTGRTLTPMQLLGRASAYTSAMIFAAAHIHAYVQKKAAETKPRPFFILADHTLRRSPTKYVARFLINRDLQNIQDLEEGRQLWKWRAISSMIKAIPQSHIRSAGDSWLAKYKKELTPAVLQRMEETGVMERLNELKAVPQKSLSAIPSSNTDFSSSYQELMGTISEQLPVLTTRYRSIVSSVEERNAARLELYDVFNAEICPQKQGIVEPRNVSPLPEEHDPATRAAKALKACIVFGPV